jgi:hypothetical protein
MKYVKKFEGNYNYEIYWKVQIKKYYYEVSIRKIGIFGDNYNYWIDEVPKQFKKDKYDEIFIFKVFNSDGTISWCWEELDYNFLERSKYMGEVKITVEDLQNEKIRQKSEKYNI